MSTVSATGTIFLRQVGAQLQTSSDQAVWSPQSTPLKFINTAPLTTTLVVLFTGTITLGATTEHLIAGSDNIQFGSTSLAAGGTPVTVTIANVPNYPGLIFNGDSGNPGFNSIRVCNVRVVATGTSTLDTGGGWIGQSYFANGASANRIVNCRSEGPISGTSGGIVGSYAATQSGSLTLIGCSSSGAIAAGGGGIVGSSAADTSGTVDVSRSYTTGTIGSDAGGIVGTDAGSASGTVRVSACYTLGATIDSDGGGIVGSKANSVVVGECSSTGSIGPSAGGIFGSQSTNSTASNCYTTGSISATGGGIYGASYGSSVANRCYTSGFLNGSTGGIFAGSGTDGVSNFSEATHGNTWTWSTTNATATLQGTAAVVGTVWVNYQTATPFRLTNIGFTPYSLTNIVTPAYTLQQTSTQSVAVGQSSSSAVVSALTHALLLITATDPGTITINTSTGALAVGSTTPVGSYTVYVMSTSGTSYLISTIALTVTSGGGGGGVSVNAVPLGFKRLQYDQFNELLFGNRLVLERLSNVNLRFNSYADFVKYRIARSTISTK